MVSKNEQVQMLAGWKVPGGSQQKTIRAKIVDIEIKGPLVSAPRRRGTASPVNKPQHGDPRRIEYLPQRIATVVKNGRGGYLASADILIRLTHRNFRI